MTTIIFMVKALAGAIGSGRNASAIKMNVKMGTN